MSHAEIDRAASENGLAVPIGSALASLCVAGVGCGSGETDSANAGGGGPAASTGAGGGAAIGESAAFGVDAGLLLDTGLTGDGDLNVDAACAATSVQVEETQLDMYLMLDSTGSMYFDNRWNNAVEALTGFVNATRIEWDGGSPAVLLDND